MTSSHEDEDALSDLNPDQTDSPELVAREQNSAESKPNLSASTDELIPWFLVGSGIMLTLLLFMRRPRKLYEWLIPFGLIGAGFYALYRRGRVMWSRHAARIRTAQEVIMAELDLLDPIARAEVLKFVAEKQLGITELNGEK